VSAAVPPAACATETLSRKVTQAIAGAGTLLDRALAAEGTKRGTRLIKKAAARLRKGSRLAETAGTKGKLSAACAVPLSDLLAEARGRLLLNIPN
jgi:hypothetical protein